MVCTIIFEVRPCLVFNTNSAGERYSKNALFHRWVDYDNKLDAFDKVKARGLVEYEDGSMDVIHPQQIKFIDNKHSEFVFDSKGDTDGCNG